METFVSMLRGINVSGQKKVSMEELKKSCESMGFRKVRTYIQSGNVIFEDSGEDIEALADRIRGTIEDHFGFEVAIVIRTGNELQEVIANLPFTKQDRSKLHVTFLSAKPSTVPTGEIDSAREGGEEFSIAGREIYLFCPNGYGRTKLTNTFFERKLKVSATTRSWRTVDALCSMANGRISS